jgi:hypothetical protein
MSKNKSIQIPANNLQSGKKPQAGGSAGNRRPNDKATQKHMDAKTFSGTRIGRRGSGAHDAPSRSPQLDPEHRIARGSAGTEGRTIHHPTHIKKMHSVPAHHPIGAMRTQFKKSKPGMFKGETGMSDFVEHKRGVPGHQSVINRGMKPTGGFKHGRKTSAHRISDIAKKLSFHQSIG